MNIRILFALMLALCFTLVFKTVLAETCPTVPEIQRHTVTAWKAYDTEDQPLSAQQEKLFIKNMVAFTLAEWTNQPHTGGQIHCYYRDKSGSNLEAYLSKNNFLPHQSNRYWYQVTGFMHCAAGMDKCNFEENKTFAHAEQRLAKK